MRKVENSTNDKVEIIITWNIQKIQSYFNSKDKVKHHSCVMYRGISSCDADYIGERIRNSNLRWNEHVTRKDKNSHRVKYLKDHFLQDFRWFVLSRASKNCLKRKILEAYYIRTCQPSFKN